VANVNTLHSKQLRKETAAARRQRILDEGGRDLRILLQKEDTAMLEKLQQWHGTPNQPETATAVIGLLIRVAAGNIPKTPDTTPYGDGYVACANNEPVTANPYSKETEDWNEWRKGWQHYDADYNADYYSTPIADDL
jgi:hypothetical protein